MVYIIAVVAALIAACLNGRMTPVIRKSILITLCMYVILVVGFRYKVGIDTMAYMNVFNRIPALDDLLNGAKLPRTRFEPGFLLVVSLCKMFSNEFWPVQMIMGALTNGCIFLFLYRYCRNVFVGILFYFLMQCLYFSMEIMRESVAIGFFLLNYKNIQEKRWLAYYLLTLPSILFHYSAAIILFFPFAKLLQSKVFFYSLCALFLLITPLVERLNEILHIAAVYGRIDQYTSGAEDLNLNWRIGELIRSAFPAIAVIFGYHISKAESKFKVMLLVQILFCLGAFAIPLIFARFTNYTSLFVAVGAANLISLPTMRHWMKILLVSFIILTQTYYYYQNYNRWIPYVSVFYPEELAYRNEIYRHSFMPWLKYRWK